MKLFRYFAVLSLIIGVLTSCDGMDATYKEFIKDGPIIYIGKADSLKAYSGRNRVMLEWEKLHDSRAKTAKIFWENRTKQVEVKLDELSEKAGKNQLLVGDLAEGSYVFEVCTYDLYGNTSIVSDVPGIVYGDAYESMLYHVKARKVEQSDEVLTITFTETFDKTYHGTEISYINSEGKDAIVILESPATSIKITNFSGSEFSYRSIYLPQPTSIDCFYSESISYVINVL